MDGLMNRWICESMDLWIPGLMDGSMDVDTFPGFVNQYIDESMDRWIPGLTDRRIDG